MRGWWMDGEGDTGGEGESDTGGEGEGDTGGEGEGDTGGESVGGIVEGEGVAEGTADGATV